jgi:hypothetical protein
MSRPNRSHVFLQALFHRLVADTRGGMLALSVILLVFVLGTGGLILDFSRVWNSQSELQAFADHAALVAAGELDGTPDAIARANAALAQLISDRQAYASQDATLDSSDLQVTFLRDLPAADTDDDFSPFATGDPALTQYVRVVVNPHTVSTIFANMLLAVSGNAQIDVDTGAAAVAGRTQYVCDISPLMFCPPSGMDQETLRSWLPGRQVRLKAQNFWGPGAFGLLDVNFDENGPCGTPNQGANFFRCAVAAESCAPRVRRSGSADASRVVTSLRERLPESGACRVQAGHDRAGRDREDFADLAIGQTVVVTQHDDLAVGIAELRDGAPDTPLELMGLGGGRGIVRSGRFGTALLKPTVERVVLTDSVTARGVADLVANDPEQPRFDRLAGVEPVDVQEEAQKRVLGDVPGSLRGAHELQCEDVGLPTGPAG